MRIEQITDNFEKEFPGLFERVCLVFYGDIEGECIDVSGESRDREGLQHDCTATVTFAHLIIELEFEDGNNAGSLIHHYESYPVAETPLGTFQYEQSRAALADKYAIEVETYFFEPEQFDIELG